MSEFVHDWAPYNRHVDVLTDQVGRPLPRRIEPPAPTDWWLIAKAVGLVILALGFVVALVIWASREPMAFGSEARAHEIQPAVTRHFEHGTEKVSPDQSKVVRNYVLFTERTLPAIGAIVTGWKFASEKDQRPIDQWCYLVPAHGRAAGVTPQINLARFDALNVPAVTLSQHQLTGRDLDTARKACAWFGGVG